MLPTLRKHATLGVVGLLVLLLVAGARPLVLAVEDLELDVLFHARARLGMEPALDRKVKIVAYDSQALVWNDSPTMTIEQLARVLELLVERGAARIAINATFSLLYSAGPETAKDALARIRALPVPVIVQGLVQERIPGRSELPHDHRSLVETRYRTPGAPPLPAWPAPPRVVAHGPDVSYDGAFPEVGSGLILSRAQYAPAFERIDAHRVLPRIALLAGGEPRWDRDGLRLGNERVPLREDGTYLVDFRSRMREASSVLPALKYLEGDGGKPFPNVQAGDTIVLGFTSYSGGESFVATPFFKDAGTWYLATQVDQALNGLWLRHADSNAVTVLVAILAAMILGTRARSIRGYAWAIAAVLPVLAGAVAAFALGRTYVPVALTTSGYAVVLTAAFLFAQHRRSLAEATARASLEKDLELANQIQDSLAPPADQTLCGRFRVVCHQVKYEALGGDWMAVREGAPGEVFVAVGDASGKGVQAALVMHAVQSLWAERLLVPSFDPAAFLDGVNMTLIKLGATRPHTATLGIIRLAPEGIRYWSAAHVAAVVSSASGTVRLPSRGNMLGLAPDLELVIRDMPWPAGGGTTHVLLGSDGVFATAKSMADRAVRQLLESLGEDRDRCLAAIDIDDDKTLVVVTVAPTSS